MMVMGDSDGVHRWVVVAIAREEGAPTRGEHGIVVCVVWWPHKSATCPFRGKATGRTVEDEERRTSERRVYTASPANQNIDTSCC